MITSCSTQLNFYSMVGLVCCLWVTTHTTNTLFLFSVHHNPPPTHTHPWLGVPLFFFHGLSQWMCLLLSSPPSLDEIHAGTILRAHPAIHRLYPPSCYGRICCSLWFSLLEDDTYIHNWYSFLYTKVIDISQEVVWFVRNDLLSICLIAAYLHPLYPRIWNRSAFPPPLIFRVVCTGLVLLLSFRHLGLERVCFFSCRPFRLVDAVVCPVDSLTRRRVFDVSSIVSVSAFAFALSLSNTNTHARVGLRFTKRGQKAWSSCLAALGPIVRSCLLSRLALRFFWTWNNRHLNLEQRAFFLLQFHQSPIGIQNTHRPPSVEYGLQLTSHDFQRTRLQLCGCLSSPFTSCMYLCSEPAYGSTGERKHHASLAEMLWQRISVARGMNAYVTCHSLAAGDGTGRVRLAHDSYLPMQTYQNQSANEKAPLPQNALSLINATFRWRFWLYPLIGYW